MNKLSVSFIQIKRIKTCYTYAYRKHRKETSIYFTMEKLVKVSKFNQ